jgi:hypothetical protein
MNCDDSSWAEFASPELSLAKLRWTKVIQASLNSAQVNPSQLNST